MASSAIKPTDIVGDTILAATSLVKWLDNYSEGKTEVVIGLCGGNSPFAVPATQSSEMQLGFLPAFLEKLSTLSKETRSKLCFRIVDERLLSDHNEVMLREKFLTPAIERGLITESQVQFYPLELADSESHGTKEYGELFGQSGFDVVILGTGYPHQKDETGAIQSYDCHIAGAFAHHESTTSDAAKKPGFVYYNQSPKPPNGRVTATLPLLAMSKLVVLIVIGQGKHEVLKECMDPQVELTDCPVKVVEKISERIVLSDYLV